MPSFSALTTLSGKETAEALAEAMEAMQPEPVGVGVFEIEDGSGLWEVGAYFLETPDAATLALLSVAFGAAEFAVSEIPEIDWVAKVRRDLTPVHAGRFFVYGSHDADKVPTDAVPLLIEAAVAFGTGHHGTTLGCLRAIDRLEAGGLRVGNVADIGCGTAVLAMAAAHAWAGSLAEPVIASDIDAVAVAVAEANVVANGLDGRVRCLEAVGFDHPEIATRAPFDLVLANILKGPLIELAPDMGHNIVSGGHAVLSGLLVSQAEDVTNAYQSAGFVEEFREDIGDWCTLTLKRA